METTGSLGLDDMHGLSDTHTHMNWRGKTRCALDSLHAVEMKDPQGGFFSQAALRMQCELQDLFVRVAKTSHYNANPLHQFKVLELRV